LQQNLKFFEQNSTVHPVSRSTLVSTKSFRCRLRCCSGLAAGRQQTVQNDFTIFLFISRAF